MKLVLCSVLCLFVALGCGLVNLKRQRSFSHARGGEATDPEFMVSEIDALWGNAQLDPAKVSKTVPDKLVEGVVEDLGTSRFRSLSFLKQGLHNKVHATTTYPPSAKHKAALNLDLRPLDVNWKTLADDGLAKIAASPDTYFSASTFTATAKKFFEDVNADTIAQDAATSCQMLIHLMRVGMIRGLVLEYEVLADLDSGALPDFLTNGEGMHVFNKGLPEPLKSAFGNKWWNAYRGYTIKGYDYNSYNFNGQYFGDNKAAFSLVLTKAKTLSKGAAEPLVKDALIELVLSSFDTIAYKVFRMGQINAGKIGDKSTIEGYFDTLLDNCSSWASTWVNSNCS
jgi:hypothetical protein